MKKSLPENNESVIYWLWTFWRFHKLWIVRIVLLSFFHAGISVLMPFLYIKIIDGIKSDMSIEMVRLYVYLLLCFGVMNFISAYLVTGSRARMNIQLEWDIRQRVFEHLLTLRSRFYLKFRTGDIVTRLTDDLGRKLSWFACSGIFRSFESSLQIIFSLVAMSMINPVLMLLTLLPLPVQFFVFVKTESLLHKRFAKLQKKISKVSDIIETCFSGIRVVQAYRLENQQKKAFSDVAKERADAEVSAEKANILVQSMYGYFWQFAVVIVLLAGGWFVITDRMTLGEYVAFDYYIGLLVFPMFDMGNLLVSYRRASVSIKRLQELEAYPPEFAIEPGKRVDTKLRGDIRLSHVALTIADSAILNDVSLHIKEGQFIALAGSVGAGKSMLLSLLIRAHDPTKGAIYIGGKNLTEIDRDEFLTSIGYVPQEPLLFSQNILDNIVFGRENVSLDDVQWALKMTQFAEEVEKFPDKLNTFIGQRGMALSGGQKQRVALARALVTRPTILLLDDVTASLDADTEENLWNDLTNNLDGITCIVVTHRPATLEKADKIYVLDQGQIVEEGRHHELMNSKKLYHRIYSRQKWQFALYQT